MNDSVVRQFTLDIEKLKNENLELMKSLKHMRTGGAVLGCGIIVICIGFIIFDIELDKEFERIDERLNDLENAQVD